MVCSGVLLPEKKHVFLIIIYSSLSFPFQRITRLVQRKSLQNIPQNTPAS